MSTLWKALIAMALALPMAAYVAGSVVATGADDLPQRAPVVIDDAPPQVVGEPPVLDPEPSPAQETGTEENGDDEADDDGIRVVRPAPTRVGDDDDDDGGGDDDSRDDDSGGDDD